ncbi:MAG: DUF948 domain-containing protein [Deltaproteobacteria bacterium]
MISLTDVAIIVLALGVAVISVSIALFVHRVGKMASELGILLESGKTALDSSIREILPAIQSLAELEKQTRETVSELEDRLSIIEDEVAPLLRHLRETVDTYQALGASIERRIEMDIPPILENISRISADMSALSADVRTKLRQTDELFHAIGEAGQTVHAASTVARKGLMGLAIQIASMATGMKTSLEFVAENISRKGGKSP